MKFGHCLSRTEITDAFHRFVEFVGEAESPAYLAFDANACAIEKPVTTGFRIGGNDFLHREAVSAGGMHSCSSVACSICNL